MKFDTVVITGERFEINMFEESLIYPQADHNPSLHQPPVSSSHRNSGDEMTMQRNDWIPTLMSFSFFGTIV